MRGYALVGFMGVGKTTVGQRLATRTGLAFCDLDAELERRFGPIPDQFATAGESGFRSREAALVRELCDGVARVLATGGGAWVDPLNRSALRGAYHVIALHAPFDVVRERVGDGVGRPLAGELRARYDARSGAYADADLHVDATLPPELVVERILEHPWM